MLYIRMKEGVIEIRSVSSLLDTEELSRLPSVSILPSILLTRSAHI